MRQVYQIDKIGNYVEPVILSDTEELPEDCVELSPPDGMYKARYNRKKKEWTDAGKPEEARRVKLPEKMRDSIETNLLLEELLSRVEALEQQKK